jgi:hypothetical protein
MIYPPLSGILMRAASCFGLSDTGQQPAKESFSVFAAILSCDESCLVRRHYHQRLLQTSLELRKNRSKSWWKRYAHQQAAILQGSVIDSFGGGTR